MHDDDDIADPFAHDNPLLNMLANGQRLVNQLATVADGAALFRAINTLDESDIKAGLFSAAFTQHSRENGGDAGVAWLLDGTSRHEMPDDSEPESDYPDAA